MSQNDFTLANQSFPAFRADLNSALQALASNNSGGSAPSTTFANMWWYDSSNNIMYIRNEDNDAWIKFAELDQANDKFVLSGTLQLDDGTVSAPALTFNSDTNMGIYRGGTDILKFVTAGTDRVTVDASGNVGIGTAPSTKLHVNGGRSTFYSQDSYAVGIGNIAGQLGGWIGSPSINVMSFSEPGGQERMRISGNNLGIGTSSPFQFSSVQAGLTLSGTSGSFATRAGALTFQSQDTTSTLCNIHARDGYMSFDTGTSTTTTERIRIHSGGQVSIASTEATHGLNVGTSGADFRGRFQGSNQYRLGLQNGTSNLVWLGSGGADNFRISNSAGSTRLEIDSNGILKSVPTNDNITGSSANMVVFSDGQFARSTSSLRYKNTINDATHGLTELLTLRPVTYKGNNDGDTVFGGLIAEEVHDAGLTEFVTYNDDGQPDALAYGNMVSLCIKAIQELKTELDEAKARITALETA